MSAASEGSVIKGSMVVGLPTRRRFLAGAAATLIFDCAGFRSICGEAVAAEQTVADEIVVTLLGTGSPEPSATRFGPATLVQAGGLNLLFDAGRGVTVRMHQLGMSFGKGLDAIFLTHYHSDHVEGLPDLWMTGYLRAPFASRIKPMRLWGPIDGTSAHNGVVKIAKGLTDTFSEDIRIRMADEQITALAAQIEPHDFVGEGVIFDEAGVKVTGFKVDHGSLIKPAVGYRVDCGSRSVTISGDTKFDENLIKHAAGTDLLIHEVCAMSAEWSARPEMKAVADHHTSPEEAGMVFSRVGPKLAVYSHFIIIGTTVADIISRTRGSYGGPLEAGEDLTRFTIGKDVTVKKWDSQLRGYPK